jgi:hypothetical protein
MIQKREGEQASIADLMPSYIQEARDVAESVIDRCRTESRHFFLLDLDFDEQSFRSSFAERGADGLLTVFRNEAAQPGTKVDVWYPANL